MKIIVASAPKTGNTWMTHLLSCIYGLPEVELPPTFDPTIANQQGPAWVTLQHYYPDPELLAWAERHRVFFVTMLRHPGDLLVSLWHMMQNKSYNPDSDLGRSTMLLLDGERMGEHTEQYVKEDFFHGLYIPLDWMETGRSLAVRYEDLWRDPVKTLTDLTNQIRPVERDRIESAIDLCDLSLLRKLYDDPQGKFFRKGGPGNWRDELPDTIVDVFRHHEPYPTIFRAWGYTLDPNDPLIDAPAKPRQSKNPFLENERFDNGVKVPVIVIKLYLLLDPASKARWAGAETATSEQSFFAWLNAPADEDPERQKNTPIVTNLAHYVYRTRSDLQNLFPDLFGEDRIEYVFWFTRSGSAEYDLDPVFIKPLQESLLAWGNIPADEDPCCPDAQPTLTNLAIYIYHTRLDLTNAFPDVFGKDRLAFARWFVEHAPDSYASDKALAAPVQRSAEIISRTLPEADNDTSSLFPALHRAISRLVKNE